MVVSILQSSYLPWIGFFDLLRRSDVFVYHNDLQYDKSWRNRNRIRSENGWTWLTVPVQIKGRSKWLLKDIEIDNSQKWARKHWNLIRQNYKRARYFEEYGASFEEVFMQKDWKYLVDLNDALTSRVLEILGIDVTIKYSEELNLGSLTKNERIVKICEEVGADTWLANSACRSYVVPDTYERAGIRVEYQDYDHPEYRQVYEPFISHLSVVDLLFNEGSNSGSIISRS